MYKSLVTILSLIVLLTSCMDTQEEITVNKPLPEKGTAEYQDLINPSGSMAENIEKVNTIYEITSKLLLDKDVKEAKFLAENQLKIALLIEYQKGQGLAYNTLAIVSRREGDTKASLEYQLKSYSIWEITNDQIGLAKSSINIGNLYRDKSLFDEAINYYNTAISLLKENGGEMSLIRTATKNLGRCYQEQGELDLAEQTYKMALDMAIEESNQRAINFLYNDLGRIYEAKGDLETALTYFNRFLELSQLEDNDYALGLAYNNVGFIEYKLDRDNEASSFLNRALEVSEEPSIQVMALQNLGILYRDNNQPEKSLSVLTQAEKIGATELGVQDLSVTTIKDLATTYEMLGNTSQALKYRKMLDEQQRQLKDAEHKLVLQAAKDFKEVEVRYASFTSSLLVSGVESKYFGYFIAALFLGLAVFVTSFYSSVYKLWRA